MAPQEPDPKPATSRLAALRPTDDGEFTRAGLWLMMAGCCLSLPVALVVLAITGTSLAESRPVFLAMFAATALTLAAVGIGRHCSTKLFTGHRIDTTGTSETVNAGGHHLGAARWPRPR